MVSVGFAPFEKGFQYVVQTSLELSIVLPHFFIYNDLYAMP